MRLLLIAVMGWLSASTTVNACIGTRPTADLSHIDEALADAKITQAEMATVKTLRQKMSDAIAFRNFKAAARIEDEAMKILHFRLDYRSEYRGGCDARWVPGRTDERYAGGVPAIGRAETGKSISIFRCAA